MTPLSKQVCSLELAKKLKDLGVRQESAFYWVANAGHCDTYKLYPRPRWDRPVSDYWLEGAYFAAFTVAELGSMLPVCILGDEQYRGSYYLHCFKDHIDDWFVQYRRNGWEKKSIIWNDADLHCGDNLADGMAEMLILLLEHNILKVEEVG